MTKLVIETEIEVWEYPSYWSNTVTRSLSEKTVVSAPPLTLQCRLL